MTSPLQDLTAAGEKLQQAVVLTRMRLAKLPASRLKARAARTVSLASELFLKVANAATSTQQLNDFMVKASGMSVLELLDVVSGKGNIARGAANLTMMGVTDRVRRAMDELAAVNAAIDKEVKHDNVD